MRQYLIVAAIALGAMFGSAAPRSALTQGSSPVADVPLATSRQDTAMAAFVRRVTAAAERDDRRTLRASIAPGARAVRIDGSRGDLASDLVARARGLSHDVSAFDTLHVGSASVLTFDNRACRTGQPTDCVIYRESWVVARRGNVPTLIARSYTSRDIVNGPNHYRATVSQTPDTARSSRDQAAVTFVGRFFAAYIGKRPDEVRDLFYRGGKLIAANGSVVEADQMVRNVGAPDPPYKFAPPAVRQILDNFEVAHSGNLTIVTFDNHVPQWRTGRPEVEIAYAEMLVLLETRTGLRLVRSVDAAHGAVLPETHARYD